MIAVLSRRWSALPANLRGAVYLVVAAAAFAAMGGLIKDLGQTLHPFQIAFFRCLFGLLVLLPLALRQGWDRTRPTRPRLHLLRTAFGLSAMFCLFYAVTELPLATVTAIVFTKPLFMIPLAVVFLREVVGWRRWTATAVGFLGALVIIRPGMGSLDPVQLAPLAASLLMGCALITVKKMTLTETPFSIVFSFAAVATLVALVPAMAVWRTPDATQLVLLALVGLGGTLGQYLTVRGYRVGESTAITPFDYVQLLFAGAIGFLFFGEMPDRWTWVGAAVIVAATFYIVRRESRAAGPVHPPPPPPDA